MKSKFLILCVLLCGWAILPARAADPVTYKEIAMLLRNGEQPQFIIDEASHRKLFQPLTPDEEDDLVSLGATPALINALRSPAILATAEAVDAYKMHMKEQKMTQLRQQLSDQQLAAQAAAVARAQQQQEAQTGQQTVQDGAPPAPNAQADEYMGKPVELQFAAADGSSVDLAGMRGKVVLIDFWATWCGPCMKEVPNVVSAYKKYHNKGFEIIGVSLDQSKAAMLKITQEKEMAWPQYFDGKGWKNEISSKFHIQAIPTMWLVNKKGIIATTRAQENLEAGIEKLLAE